MTAVMGAELLDVGTFAAEVLGRPLWPHQLDLARSSARYRVVCAGRQVGKSTLLASLALHTAATRRNVTVLLVSAGEEASKRLLADCAQLAQGHLAGSVLDESRSTLTFSNGSTIRSVPASERQIRGWPVDLLIVDEAGFVGTDIWRSAEPAIIARPSSRVVLASSPWGTPDHWFRSLWQRGTDTPDEHVAAWHWPSSVSPLVDAALLAQIEQREAPDYFRREFLAEWTDAAGSYFTEAELMAGVADYAMTAPEDVSARGTGPCAAGVDWGLHRDANALVLLARMESTPDGRARLFVPWCEARSGWPFEQFIERIGDVSERYRVRVLASERNGIGEYPSTELEHRLHMRRTGTFVAPVWTTARRKMSGFGRIKGLLQSGRLVLPLHPPLLSELRALEFEQLAAGGLRIAVPERAGHDDLAMALLQAVSCVDVRGLRDEPPPMYPPDPAGLVETGAGALVPRRPRPDRDYLAHLGVPGGEDGGDGW